MSDEYPTPQELEATAAEARIAAETLSRLVGRMAYGSVSVARQAEIDRGAADEWRRKYRALTTTNTEHPLVAFHIRHRDGLVALLRMWGCVSKPIATAKALNAEYQRAHARVRSAWTIDEFAEAWDLALAQVAHEAEVKRAKRRKPRE